MNRAYPLYIVRLETAGLLALTVTAVLGPIAARGQSYCGPVTLIHFNGPNGQYSIAGVMSDSQGNMYGPTAEGGRSFNPTGNNGILNAGLGILGKYSSNTGLTTLFSFRGNTTLANKGYRPMTSLVMGGSATLYGTTYYGGKDFFPDHSHFGLGTMFKFSSLGQFTTLHEFFRLGRRESFRSGARQQSESLGDDLAGRPWLGRLLPKTRFTLSLEKLPLLNRRGKRNSVTVQGTAM